MDSNSDSQDARPSDTQCVVCPLRFKFKFRESHNQPNLKPKEDHFYPQGFSQEQLQLIKADSYGREELEKVSFDNF